MNLLLVVVLTVLNCLTCRYYERTTSLTEVCYQFLRCLVEVSDHLFS